MGTLGFRKMDAGDCFLYGFYTKKAFHLFDGFILKKENVPIHNVLISLGNLLYDKRSRDSFIYYNLDAFYDLKKQKNPTLFLLIEKWEKDYSFSFYIDQHSILLKEANGKFKDIVLNEYNVEKEMENFFKLFRLLDLFIEPFKHFDILFNKIYRDFDLQLNKKEYIRELLVNELKQEYTVYQMESESHRLTDYFGRFWDTSGDYYWFSFLNKVLVFRNHADASDVFIFSSMDEAKSIIDVPDQAFTKDFLPK